MEELIAPEKMNDLQHMLIDLLAGDESILARSEYRALRPESIKLGLDFILNNERLTQDQKSALVANSWRINFRDKPPTPQEFISEKYLGRAAAHTYQRIKDVFVQFMDAKSSYRNLILYPHIGWGKSYLATLVNIYVGVNLSMMRNPWEYLGLNPATLLAQLLVSYSLKKSSELLLEPLLAILESSSFFEKVHTREGMIKKEADFERKSHIDKIYWTTAVPTSAIQMSNGANIKLASSVASLLGLSVVTGTMSELSFFRDAGKDDEYIMRVLNDLKGRIDSRMRGNYFGRSILDSSPNTLDSPIDDYIVNHARKDATNLVVDGSVWEWAPEDYDMTKTFKVFVGGKGEPPKIIEEGDENLVKTYGPTRMIDVPLQLKQFFQDDLYKSLKDRAGIPAGSSDNLIYDYDKIEQIFNTNLKNIYTHITASSEMSPINLIWDQIEGIFFKTKIGSLEFWYKPYLPRFVSVDQSVSQDMTCIAMGHAERERETNELVYVMDFTITIAPLGSRINLEAIKLFIEDLRIKGNLHIAGISFDQFQSESTIQYLKLREFEVEKLSVDKTTDPYMHLISLVNTKKIFVGRNLHVKNNLKSLKMVKMKTKMKVDHEDSRAVVLSGTTDWDKSKIGYYAKDATDAIAAVCEMIRRESGIPFEEWDPDKLIRLNSGDLERENALDKSQELMAKFGVRVG